MSAWDFIREAYLGTLGMLLACGTWLVQNWLIVFIVAALACIGVGLWHEIKHQTQGDQPPHLSQDDIGKLNAMNTHGTRMLPLQADEMVALAQDWLNECRDGSESQVDGFDNPS